MSEVSDNLLIKPDHAVNWQILTNAPKQVNKQMILEAFYIQTLTPTLNNQLNTKCTLLFRNGIT